MQQQNSNGSINHSSTNKNYSLTSNKCADDDIFADVWRARSRDLASISNEKATHRTERQSASNDAERKRQQ